MEMPAAPRRAVPVRPFILLLVVAAVVAVPLLLGLAGGLKGKEARVPLPAGAEIMQVVPDDNPDYSDAQRELFAVRVIVVPMPMADALAYYETGPGAMALQQDGWDAPIVQETSSNGSVRTWFRYEGDAQQVILVDIGDASWHADRVDPSVFAGIDPQTSSVMRVQCGGSSLREYEYFTP